MADSAHEHRQAHTGLLDLSGTPPGVIQRIIAKADPEAALDVDAETTDTTPASSHVAAGRKARWTPTATSGRLAATT